MQNILIIGEENKAQYLKNYLEEKQFSIQVSDGDEEEDFKEFDIIFDLNFDDDSENFSIYAGLRDKLIFLSTVKLSLSEASYVYPTKVRSRLFGLNCIFHYLQNEIWEISTFRGNELFHAEEFLKRTEKKYFIVDDIVGHYRPRVDFLRFNECAHLMEKGVVLANIPKEIQNDFQAIDNIGITDVFETLMAIYEDTKDFKYHPCALLKKKYLRNHSFIK